MSLPVCTRVALKSIVDLFKVMHAILTYIKKIVPNLRNAK